MNQQFKRKGENGGELNLKVIFPFQIWILYERNGGLVERRKNMGRILFEGQTNICWDLKNLEKYILETLKQRSTQSINLDTL